MREFSAKAGRQLVKDYVAFPALTSLSPAATYKSTLKANMVANVIRNIWANAVIFCGHFPDGAEKFTKTDMIGETKGQWYLRQMLGSANFDAGPAMRFMSGNLCYQIEHHLYPDLPSNRLHEISVRVRQVCDKYDLAVHHRLVPDAVRQDVAHHRQTVAAGPLLARNRRRRSGDPQRADVQRTGARFRRDRPGDRAPPRAQDSDRSGPPMASECSIGTRVVIQREQPADQIADRRVRRHNRGDPHRLTAIGGLAALSLDALSSVAYGPEAIVLILVAAGAAAVRWTLPIAMAITVLLLVLVVSYRQVIAVHPNGGGAYAVANKDLGRTVSLLAAASLVVDYVLTLAVDLGGRTARWRLPVMAHRRLLAMTIAGLVLLTALEAGRIAESAKVLMDRRWCSSSSIFAIIIVGFIRPRRVAIGADRAHRATRHWGWVLILKAFVADISSLTGVEAIANAVPQRGRVRRQARPDIPRSRWECCREPCSSAWPLLIRAASS